MKEQKKPEPEVYTVNQMMDAVTILRKVYESWDDISKFHPTLFEDPTTGANDFLGIVGKEMGRGVHYCITKEGMLDKVVDLICKTIIEEHPNSPALDTQQYKSIQGSYRSTVTLMNRHLAFHGMRVLIVSAIGTLKQRIENYGSEADAAGSSTGEVRGDIPEPMQTEVKAG